MIPDFAISIGSTHSVHGVCQDYARFGGTPDRAYVLVADGCSSSKDSEIGAKLLILAAEKYVQQDLTDQDYHEKTIVLAETYAQNLGLPSGCLDATLLTIRKHGALYYATIYGDGVVVQRQRYDNWYMGKPTGIQTVKLHVAKVSYASGYPNYLSYRLDPKRIKDLDMTATVQHCEIHEDGSLHSNYSENINYEAQGKFCFSSKMMADSDFMAIMSDGVVSFLQMQTTETSKMNVAVNYEKVLPELLAFKNFQPGYAKRRLQRALKDAQARNWQHHDDLSIAVLARTEADLEKSKSDYPPIKPGTRVKTLIDPNCVMDDWVDTTKRTRKSGVTGRVLTHHDSHGLCFEVKHDDGVVSAYEPQELIEIKDNKSRELK